MNHTYRKRPIEIEAWRLPPVADRGRVTPPSWLLSALLKTSDCDGALSAAPNGGMTVHTLEGAMVCNVGDWIIRGVKGELYPCKPDIFEATYEPVPSVEAG